MASPLSLRDTILNAWKTNHRVTVFLVEHLPAELWQAKVPGAPRRTIRMLAGHIHNARCMWIKTLGKEHGLAVPRSVDRYKVKPKDLIPALQRSSTGILRHEGHHRGQIVMLARQLAYRLPVEVTGGLWHWSKRAREV